MESIVALELEEVKKRLTAEAGTNDGVILMQRYFQLSLLNVLWGMMAGRRYEAGDPKLETLLEINSGWFQSGNFGAGIVTAFPFLRFVFPEWTGYNKQMAANRAIHNYLRVNLVCPYCKL
jgi:methyl farnesoate epoxidase/farnesoate epoxidase